MSAQRAQRLNMDAEGAADSPLRTFQLDAEQLLAMADDCLAHLHLIDSDADACRCLNTALTTLVRRSTQAGALEVTRHAEHLRHLLAEACRHRRLARPVLACAQACLTLLAWQLELIDPQTGRVDLDEREQQRLLEELAGALHAAGLPRRRPSVTLLREHTVQDP